MDISVEALPAGDTYCRAGGVLARVDANGNIVYAGGVTQSTDMGLFRKPTMNIFMSSHKTLDGFTLALNHEFIHAYHRFLGLPSLLGNAYRAATEQAAYLHDFMHATNPWQFFNAINGLNSYRSPYILPLPKYLIKF